MDSHLAVAFFAILLLHLELFLLLLHFVELSLHNLDASFLLHHSLLDLVLFLLLGSLLIHDLLVQLIHLLLVISCESLDLSLVLVTLGCYDLLFVLNGSFRFLMLDLLDPLCPSILEELAHHALDMFALRLQCFEELLLFFKSVSFADFIDVPLVLSILILFVRGILTRGIFYQQRFLDIENVFKL